MLAFTQYVQEQAQHAEPLSAGGWTMMILSIGAVTSIAVYCYVRILAHPELKEPELPGGLGP